MAKQTIDEMAILITANNSRLKSDLDKSKKEFDQFAKDVANAHPPPPKPPDMRAYRQAAKEAASFRAQARAAGESVAGFVAKVAATGGTILAFEAGLTGIAGAFDQVKQSVRMAAELEQTKLGFEVMLGDARQAAEMVADVRRFAATTPFNTRDLTDATRQLIAYGRSAEVAMDDLRMLGDVSAAFGARLPIGDLTYLYGTLYAQQRAFTKDLYQFAGRGIPIWRELGKVTGKNGMELRDMVEDGRIGFEDVRKAFVAMTSAGGQFYGMTARQGQTVAGVIEQMTDAFEMLKIEFGQILIDELGIKEGARELQAFADRLRENAGEIRPVVKFVGDLARAGAQLSYEFTRAGVAVGSMNLNALTQTFPGLKAAADSFHRMVEDAKNFKLDEEKLIDFGADVADLTVRTFAAVADTIKTMWQSAQAQAAPLLRTMERLDQFAQWMSANRAGPTPGPDRATLFPAFGVVDRSTPPPRAPLGRRDSDPINRFGVAPPEIGMSVDRVRAEWEALNSAIADSARLVEEYRAGVAAGRLAPYLLREREQVLADAHRRRFEFQSGFVGNPLDVRQWLDAGQVPPIRGGWGDPTTARGLVTPRDSFMAAIGPAGLFKPQEKSFAETARQVVEEMRQTMLAAARLRRDTQAAAEAAEANQRALRGALFGPAAVVAPTPPSETDRALARFTAALGGPAGLFHVAPPPIPPDIDALRNEIRREYDPRREIEAFRAQLDQIQSRGLLGPNTDALVNRAWRDRLTQIGGKLGIENRYQLPEAATVGTSEDARIITAWRTQGTNQVTTDGLLQQILQAIQAQTAVNAGIPRGIARELPVPRVVDLPH